MYSRVFVFQPAGTFKFQYGASTLNETPKFLHSGGGATVAAPPPFPGLPNATATISRLQAEARRPLGLSNSGGAASVPLGPLAMASAAAAAAGQEPPGASNPYALGAGHSTTPPRARAKWSTTSPLDQVPPVRMSTDLPPPAYDSGEQYAGDAAPNLAAARGHGHPGAGPPLGPAWQRPAEHVWTSSLQPPEPSTSKLTAGFQNPIVQQGAPPPPGRASGGGGGHGLPIPAAAQGPVNGYPGGYGGQPPPPAAGGYSSSQQSPFYDAAEGMPGDPRSQPPSPQQLPTGRMSLPPMSAFMAASGGSGRLQQDILDSQQQQQAVGMYGSTPPRGSAMPAGGGNNRASPPEQHYALPPAGAANASGLPQLHSMQFDGIAGVLPANSDPSGGLRRVSNTGFTSPFPDSQSSILTSYMDPLTDRQTERRIRGPSPPARASPPTSTTPMTLKQRRLEAQQAFNGLSLGEVLGTRPSNKTPPFSRQGTGTLSDRDMEQ